MKKIKYWLKCAFLGEPCKYHGFDYLSGSGAPHCWACFGIEIRSEHKVVSGGKSPL